jgi:hypothetical protein
MTDSVTTTVDLFTAFDNSRHTEALENIRRAMRGESDPRREAMLSLIPSHVELGYSRGPQPTRVSGAILTL